MFLTNFLLILKISLSLGFLHNYKRPVKFWPLALLVAINMPPPKFSSTARQVSSLFLGFPPFLLFSTTLKFRIYLHSSLIF